VPLWQMPNDVTYCQQLPTVQAGGGCSDCIHQMAEDSRYTQQQQQHLAERASGLDDRKGIRPVKTVPLIL